MIAIDLSKQQAPDADPRAIQQINFTANLNRAEQTTMFFIIKEAKEAILDFSQGTVKVLWISPYDLARLALAARVAKVFNRTVCSTILFYFNIISI